MIVTIIGFGEAGPVFGKALLDSGETVVAYDKLQADKDAADQQRKKTLDLGITPASSMTAAVENANLVISTVTAAEAAAAAQLAAPALNPNAHWLDLNSVSPETKSSIRDAVTHKGATFTEAVAMDTVPAKGIQVPLLFCGPQAGHWSDYMNNAGFNSRVISDNYGAASTTKLLRSVLIKGMEALFAESMEAAAVANVHNEVIDSLQATYPGIDWRELAGYQLSRASIHATRRAAEMRESAAVVASLGVNPIMAEAAAKRQQDLSDRQIGSGYSGNSVEDFINAIIT